MSNFLSYRIAHKSQVERTGCMFIARSDDLAFLAVVRSTALPFESWYPDELGEQQSFTLLFFVCCPPSCKHDAAIKQNRSQREPLSFLLWLDALICRLSEQSACLESIKKGLFNQS
jgi:hypothetical protein